MRKSRFSEQQIIALLRERRGGRGDCRHGISSAGIRNRKAKFAGSDCSDAERLRMYAGA